MLGRKFLRSTLRVVMESEVFVIERMEQSFDFSSRLGLTV